MREKELRKRLPRRWYVPVEFTLTDVAEWLTESEYARYSKICPQIKINLHYDYTPEDQEVGIPDEYFEWNGDWSLPPIGNYPDKVKEAIDAYLNSIDVDQKWAHTAKAQADNYLDSMIYPEL